MHLFLFFYTLNKISKLASSYDETYAIRTPLFSSFKTDVQTLYESSAITIARQRRTRLFLFDVFNTNKAGQ